MKLTNKSKRTQHTETRNKMLSDDQQNKIDAILNGPKPAPWRDRKRTVISTLTFCALCVGYIMFSGKDLQVYQTIVLGCFGLAGSVIAVFIGGQTWHDINNEKLKAVTSITNQPQMPPQPTPKPVATVDSNEK